MQPQTRSFAPAQLARMLAYLTQGMMASQQPADADAVADGQRWLELLLEECERLEGPQGKLAEAAWLLAGSESVEPGCDLLPPKRGGFKLYDTSPTQRSPPPRLMLDTKPWLTHAI